MSITGCLADYRLDTSIFIWVIFIGSSFMFAIFFIIKGVRSNLLNKKEIFIGASVQALGVGIVHLFIQLGIFYIEQFHFFLFLGFVLSTIMATPINYTWEKNLTDMKKIPTILNIIVSVVTIINFIVFLFNQGSLTENFQTVFLFLILIPPFLSAILVISFIKKVSGKLRTYGFIAIIGLPIYLIGGILDHPPGCNIQGLSPVISPLLMMTGVILLFYGIYKITGDITSFYTQTRLCLVHRGKILDNSQIYVCPSCGAFYCINCYKNVIQFDGCWNCGALGKNLPEAKKEEELSREDLIIKDEGIENHLEEQEPKKKKK
jgi:hypothetical protein